MTYQFQTNGQMEKYNKTIATRLCDNLNEHQDDWYSFLQLLTYNYNSQANFMTSMPSFLLNMIKEPLCAADIRPA